MKTTLLEDVAEVQVVRVLAETHLQNYLRVLDVVQNDLLHLGEVPAVPLLHTHRVDVDLLVQLVQKTDGLDDHRVYLIGTELQLVTTTQFASARLPAETVRQTQNHRVHVLVGNRIQQRVHLVADSTHELVHTAVVNAFNIQFVLDQTRQLRIGHGEFILQLRLHNRLLQKLAEVVVQRTIHQSRSSSQRLRGVLELLEIDELQTIPCSSLPTTYMELAFSGVSNCWKMVSAFFTFPSSNTLKRA